MKKVLINLFSHKMVEGDFELYSRPFVKEFEVFNYYFDVQDMFPTIVEAIIFQLEQTENIELVNTVFVVQTNVVDLGHFSAKFYSELVNSVVIIPKKIDILSRVHKEYAFVREVAKFKMNGQMAKVYVQEVDVDDVMYLAFLYNNRLFGEITSVKEFAVAAKKMLQYDLVFDTLDEKVETAFHLSAKKTFIKQDISSQSEDVFTIDCTYGLSQIMKLVLEYDVIDSDLKEEYLKKVINRVKALGKQQEMIHLLFERLKNAEISFNTFVDYNYMCMILGDKDGLMRLYSYVEKNIAQLDRIQLQGLLTNSLFYKTQLGQVVTPDVYKHRLAFTKHIKSYWLENLTLPSPIQSTNNKIAVVVGQLLGTRHSPTKLALDYVNMLKKYNPTVQIKLFVDDWVNYSSDDITWVCRFNSADSKTFSSIHQDYLQTDVDIYYSNSELNRKERVLADVKAIIDFEPTLIYKIGSSYNVVTDVLYDYYPVVSQTIGDPEECYYVDVFTGGREENVVKEFYAQNGLLNPTYIKHTAGLLFEEPSSIIDRKALNLNEKDFVLVTVGNRLKVEMDAAFIEEVMSVLAQYKDCKWVIVGETRINFIHENYKQYVDSKQVIFHGYEENLIGLYKACDVYVNPRRESGGFSGAMAMFAALPVVTSDETSDVGLYVGAHNCVQLSAFRDEIIKLKQDAVYYKAKAQEMKQRIDHDFSFEQTVRDLQLIFNAAIEKFNDRKKEVR